MSPVRSWARQRGMGDAARCLVAALLAGALLLAGCGEKPVVTVNGLSVKEDEFGDRCATYVFAANPQTPSVGLQVLADLIRLKAIEKAVRDANTYPSDADVDRRVAALKRQAAFFQQPVEQQLRQQGRSEEAFRRDVRDSMIADAYFLRGTTATEPEAKQFYDTHPNDPDWSQKERVRFSMLAVSAKDQLAKVMEELRSGANFGTVAAAYSMGDLKNTRGQVNGWYSRDDLKGTNLPFPQPVLQAVFELKPGQFTNQPVKMQMAQNQPVWVVAKLEEKKPAESIPFPEIQEVVIRRVRQEKSNSKREELARGFATMMKDTEIEVSRPEWEEFVRQYRGMLQAQGNPAMPSGHSPDDGHNHGPAGTPPAGP